jgi:transcriptional regulator with XRE-family HTH domain
MAEYRESGTRATAGIRRLRERLTQKQLANLAQVSQQSVSLAECGSPRISQETKDKIELAAQMLLHRELKNLEGLNGRI